MNALSTLFGRFGLSLIFILSGWAQIGGYAGTQQSMEAMGVPAHLLPPVTALALGGGLALSAGLFTRWVARAFAVFAVSSRLRVHCAPAQPLHTNGMTAGGGRMEP